MKKIIAFTVLTFMCCYVYSQQDTILKNKKGRDILPQKGEIALGMSVNNIFNYLGNMFSSSGNNYLALNLLNGNSFFGKYYLTSKSALRLKVAISQSNYNYENKIPDDLNANSLVIDKLKTSNSGFTIFGGYEKRKGAYRLQFSYGGEFGMGYSSNVSKYSYGNQYSITNTAPLTTTNFSSPFSSHLVNRPLEFKQSSGIMIGARTFCGVEYFFLPKISVGGEFGLGFNYHFIGRNINSSESWDYGTDKVVIQNNKTNYNSTSLNTDIFNGQIFILFHLK